MFCYKNHTRTSIVKWEGSTLRRSLLQNPHQNVDRKVGVAFYKKLKLINYSYKKRLPLYDRRFRVGFEAKYDRKVDSNVGFPASHKRRLVDTIIEKKNNLFRRS